LKPVDVLSITETPGTATIIPNIDLLSLPKVRSVTKLRSHCRMVTVFKVGLDLSVRRLRAEPSRLAAEQTWDTSMPIRGLSI
jgi:hypothetical protein